MSFCGPAARKSDSGILRNFVWIVSRDSPKFESRFCAKTFIHKALILNNKNPQFSVRMMTADRLLIQGMKRNVFLSVKQLSST